MVIGWIVLTLLIAVVAGLIAAAVLGDGFGFVFGFVGTIQLSLLIALIYVGAHFIGKFW